MLHPFSEDTKNLTVQQCYDKIAELTNKYFSTQNPQLREQISTFIEYYKQEAITKEAQLRIEQQNQDNGNLDLDSLINIS
jgi:hypothetical protein